MQNNNYLNILILFIQKQKVLCGVVVLCLMMIIAIVVISNTGSETKKVKTGAYYPQPTNNPQQNLPAGSQANIPAEFSPSPTDSPWTTKFIYFIGSVFTPKSPSPSPGQNRYGYTGSRRVNISNAPGQNQTQDGSGNNSSGGGGGGGSPGGTGGSQNNSPNNPGGNPNYPSPTPVTDIKIVFKNQDGTYFTYVPPAVPPVDVSWLRYINYQDHYAIDYPANWQMVKTTYNGHEAITLYSPTDANNIDKPSLAFVGWKADYLTSSANYTGTITLNDIGGTVYTNGPLGLSSVAAVFQYKYGYFAFGSSSTNPVFIYIFDHMLRSIDFNVQ